MAKFFFFEKIVSVFYTHVFTSPKSSYSKTTQLGVTFASGYLAGVVCAVVPRAVGAVARDARGLGGARDVVGGVGVRYGGVSGEEGEPRVDELEAFGEDTGGTEAVTLS